MVNVINQANSQPLGEEQAYYQKNIVLQGKIWVRK